MDSEKKTEAPVLPADRGQLQAAQYARSRNTLTDARVELHRLNERLEQIRREQAEIQRRIPVLQAKIEVLEPICAETEQWEKHKLQTDWVAIARDGIQECCYKLLVEEGGALAAWEVRQLLEERGVDMSQYSNPSAVIHTSLKRIPERVRSFKQRRGCTGDWKVERVYEAIERDSPESEDSPK